MLVSPICDTNIKERQDALIWNIQKPCALYKGKFTVSDNMVYFKNSFRISVTVVFPSRLLNLLSFFR